MGEIARMLALEAEVTHEGQLYKLAPASAFEVQGLFEQHLTDSAYAEIMTRFKRTGDLDAMRADRAALQANIVSGDYDFMGPVSLKAQRSIFGKAFANLLLIRLQLGNPNTKFTIDAARKIAMDQGEKILALFEAEMASDPNLRAPSPGAAQNQGSESSLQPSGPAASAEASSPAKSEK